jgi:hypothetical protein
MDHTIYGTCEIRVLDLAIGRKTIKDAIAFRLKVLKNWRQPKAEGVSVSPT